ncbi:hypothetical protein [Gemmata obscuriglobus]|uniref:hypothetical protein n=1 Tax=Gemmata obscuriglobus TaxID=114 RepID=UPI0012FB5B7F|nr:hypothetical protein [Gemmata obscuriglobus]
MFDINPLLMGVGAYLEQGLIGSHVEVKRLDAARRLSRLPFYRLNLPIRPERDVDAGSKVTVYDVKLTRRAKTVNAERLPHQPFNLDARHLGCDQVTSDLFFYDCCEIVEIVPQAGVGDFAQAAM